MKKNSMYAPTIVLVCICLVASILLALTYQVTAPQIAKINEEQAIANRKEVLPEADKFELVEAIDTKEGVTEVYKASNGAGYVLTSKAKGFGGQLTVMTAIGNDGNVLKVKVTDASTETPGLGQKVLGADYQAQYTGAANITNNSDVKDATYIQGISGATYSSKGVFNAVSYAIEKYQSIK